MLDQHGKPIPKQGEIGWLEYEVSRQGGIQEDIRKMLADHCEAIGGLKATSRLSGALGGAITAMGMGIMLVVGWFIKNKP